LAELFAGLPVLLFLATVVFWVSFLAAVDFTVEVFGLGVVFLAELELLLVEGFGERKSPLLLPKSCPKPTIDKTKRKHKLAQNLTVLSITTPQLLI
jgi:hypothetical protein